MSSVQSAGLAFVRHFGARRSSSVTLRHSPLVASARGFASLSGGEALEKLASEFPHMDAVRYHHKNIKWTFKNVNFYSDALATGFLDSGLQPDDIVLSWLPIHFAEQHILQFACSKAGFILYHLDPSQAITDPKGAKDSLAKALEETKANVLISQESGNDVSYYRLLTELIPEIRIFNFEEGMPFITPRFPHLRFPMHTGFDSEGKAGMVPYKHMLVDSGERSKLLGGATLTGSTPLMGVLTKGPDGLPRKGKVLTNEEVEKSNEWPEYRSILKREYIEVEGVGVVF